MNTATAQQNNATNLYAVLGGIHHQSGIVQQKTNTIWLFAYTALWNGQTFSVDEIATAKTHITHVLMQAGSIQSNYEQTIQRILLTRNYLNNHPQKFVPLPSQWFNPQNTNGFAGTSSWYLQIVQKRKALPVYKYQWQLLTQAIQELINNPTAYTFHYWRTHFVESGNQKLLNLFLSFAANASF
jgi:hypothetical protein